MLTGALGGPPGPGGTAWGTLGNPVGGGGGGLLCKENKKKIQPHHWQRVLNQVFIWLLLFLTYSRAHKIGYTDIHLVVQTSIPCLPSDNLSNVKWQFYNPSMLTPKGNIYNSGSYNLYFETDPWMTRMDRMCDFLCFTMHYIFKTIDSSYLFSPISINKQLPRWHHPLWRDAPD